MNNYVRLNNLLDNEAVTLIVAICFMVLIFAIGFCLRRNMRIKELEDKWDKELGKLQKDINEALGRAGVFKEMSLRRENNK